MKEGHINYKFKSEINYSTVTFYGDFIKVKELKKLISN